MAANCQFDRKHVKEKWNNVALVTTRNTVVLHFSLHWQRSS